MQHLGKRLRALRKERGLTLAQLGQRVGLSVSYLSQLERSVTMPSLPGLTTIAGALGVEVGYFFADDASLCSSHIVRLNQSRRLGGTAGVVIEVLSADLSDKKIQPFRLVCQPGASSNHSPTHPGEEVCFVLKGQLMVTVDGETFVLEAGDSIHYQAIQPHSWRNEGDQECIVIWTISPPIPEAELGKCS